MIHIYAQSPLVADDKYSKQALLTTKLISALLVDSEALCTKTSTKYNVTQPASPPPVIPQTEKGLVKFLWSCRVATPPIMGELKCQMNSILDGLLKTRSICHTILLPKRTILSSVFAVCETWMYDSQVMLFRWCPFHSDIKNIIRPFLARSIKERGWLYMQDYTKQTFGAHIHTPF